MDLRIEPAHHALFRERDELRNEPRVETILRFDHVTLFFDDDVHALDDVSFDLKKGETRILFGAAGSGKSVLLKCSLGLLKPQSGAIELFGQDITKVDETDLFQIRAGAGILFQESALFDSLTVRENVAYPLVNQASSKRAALDENALEGRVREALRFVELEQTLDKFPSELSGGMRRRVGIARAAVTDPPLILYDSPTAGLDPITANTIIALILKARDTRHTTSMLVTHRYQDGHMVANYRYNSKTTELEPAPRDSGVHDSTIFMVFREGKLAFEGTQEELQRATDPYISKFKSNSVRRSE
jgi:phospholipid/cholesterol/gamma-HCH transport system ATP-binding protein